jgi:ribonuclease HI
VNNVIFDVCRFEDELTVGKFAMAVWCIWHNRNNWVWKGVKDSAKEVAMCGAHMLAEWCVVNTMQQTSSFESVAAVTHAAVYTEYGRLRESHDIQLICWQKPRDGWWKCNVDASFSHSPCYTGWGWCLRDSAGCFSAAGTNICRNTLTVVEGEAMTILEAMRVAISKGWSNIIFESDSKVVVDAVYSNNHGNSEWSSIILSIKSILQCNPNFEVKFTKRQANMAAHKLARVAYSWSSRTYFNIVPRCFARIIINEMS